LTLRTFMSSLDFVHDLILRFNISEPSSLSNQEQSSWIDRKLKPIRLRVLNLLRIWVESYYVEAISGDSKALAEINDFVSEIAVTEFPQAAQQLLRSIESRRNGEAARRPSISYAYALSSTATAMPPHPLSSSTTSSTSVFTQQPAITTAPPPILPRSLRRIRFLDIDPLELARQLTILEAEIFRNSPSHELLKKAWSDKENPGAAPAIRRMIEVSNQITFWVASAVLREKDVKKRGSIMKHFILIADVSWRCILFYFI
jgi:son of sevenless